MNRFFFALFFSLAPASQAAERPNVVILYADDMGVADVSYGDPKAKIQTPHLDRLASQGMTFTDGHSSSGICTPSRFALLTGQHHWRRFHGIVGAFGGTVFEPEDFTIAKMFKKKGYRTGCFGKWHLGWDFDAIRKPGAKKGIREPSPMTGPNAFLTVRSIRASTTILETEPLTSLPIVGSRETALSPFPPSPSSNPGPSPGAAASGRDRWPKVGTPTTSCPPSPKRPSSGFRNRKRMNPSSLTSPSIHRTTRSFPTSLITENRKPVTTGTSSSRPTPWWAR